MGGRNAGTLVVSERRKGKKRKASDVRTPEPEVHTPEPDPIEDRAARPHLYWPHKLTEPERQRLVNQLGPDGLDERDHPSVWLGARPTYPCAKCERIRRTDGTQAVVCYGAPAAQGVAFLLCRVCGYKWKLPIL